MLQNTHCVHLSPHTWPIVKVVNALNTYHHSLPHWEEGAVRVMDDEGPELEGGVQGIRDYMWYFITLVVIWCWI